MRVTRRQFIANTIATGVLPIPAVGAASSIHTRPIPSSGEQIPIIGLGTNRYGGNPDDGEREPLRAALRRFFELGGTLIDTAPAYGNSETVLGDLLAELGATDRAFLATKVDQSPGGRATEAQIRDSGRLLRRPVLDLEQIHNLRAWQEALPVIRECKEAGIVRYVGITTSRESQYDELERVMRNESLDFVQLNYSLEQRAAEERLLPLAADRGIAVMINRAFGGGRLFRRLGDQPLPDWSREFDCASWAQFLLKFALSHPAATVAIPGMTKAHHVDDNLAAGTGQMPHADLRRRQVQFFEQL